MIHRRAPTPRVGGAAGDRGASPARRHGETSPAAPGPLRVARRASHEPPSATFRRARLVGGACPIGERGQDAAYSCPKCCGGTLCSPRRCPPGRGAGAARAAPQRLASCSLRAQEPRRTRAPGAPGAHGAFLGAAQTNGDRATRPPARNHKKTLPAHPRWLSLRKINGDRATLARARGSTQ